MFKIDIPKETLNVIAKLQKSRLSASRQGFQAYLVGGCVRDLLMEREPKDWDIATDAKPEEIQKIFSESVYENQFGTVGVKTESNNEKLKIIEITTFRIEGKYSDQRHPDEIKFAKTIEEDLGRRDFTINAMALQIQNVKIPAYAKASVGRKNQNDFEQTSSELYETNNLKFKIIDPFNGQEDIKNKIIRTVGNPDDRFNEDALRLIRGIRFSVELGFRIEEKTTKAIKNNADLIKIIAKERIRDEIIKILMAKNAKRGIEILEELGILKHIIPELREGIGVGQNKHHKYTVWEHSLHSLDYAALENYSLAVRIAALFHDMAKPRTKTGNGPESHFYGHDIISAKMAEKILRNLAFPKEEIEKTSTLIRYHMFKADTEEITGAAIRRTIRAVGAENIWELINLRTADRIGSGVPKAWPYRLRSYMALVEKNLREPVSLKEMILKGDDVMKVLTIPPGPKIGWILYILFEEILDDPSKNNYDYLAGKAIQLGKLDNETLKKLAEKSKQAYEQLLSEEEEEIKKKYYVK